MKRAGVVTVGLFVAAIGQFLGLALAGAGHGWITPLWASIILWVGYPLVLLCTVNAASVRNKSLRFELAVVLLALVSDAALVVRTIEEGTEYFWKMVAFDGWLVGLWIAIWLGWQLIALINVARTRRSSGDAA